MMSFTLETQSKPANRAVYFSKVLIESIAFSNNISSNTIER